MPALHQIQQLLTSKPHAQAQPPTELASSLYKCLRIVFAAGVFNIEGGCYAKVLGITPDSPPGLHQALR
jgi:hypothetical protein